MKLGIFPLISVSIRRGNFCTVAFGGVENGGEDVLATMTFD